MFVCQRTHNPTPANCCSILPISSDGSLIQCNLVHNRQSPLIQRALHLILEGNWNLEEFMAALIDAINVKRKTLFELENTPFYCLEAEVNTPTARGGQTLVRLKMRNLLTNAVFEKTFKASDKFKEPDLVFVDASYLYSDGDGSHFLDQESFETLTLNEDMVGDG